jgi:hypothetical protein
MNRTHHRKSIGNRCAAFHELRRDCVNAAGTGESRPYRRREKFPRNAAAVAHFYKHGAVATARINTGPAFQSAACVCDGNSR